MYCQLYLERLYRMFEFQLELDAHTGGTNSLCSPALVIDRTRGALSFAAPQVKILPLLGGGSAHAYP